jgi:HlyD family secretion protein
VKLGVKLGIAAVAVVALGVGGYMVYKHFNRSGHMGGGRDMGITEKVEKQSLVSTVSATGAVLLKDEIEVYAEGEVNKIKKIMVEEGDDVTVGELLVEYDVDDTKEELENKIRDTKRSIENSELSIKSLTAASSDSDIAKLNNTLVTKQKALTDAKTTLESYTTKLAQQQTTIDNAEKEAETALKKYNDGKELLAVGGISQQELDELEKSSRLADTELSKAKDDYNDLLTAQSSAKESVTTAECAITEAQAALNDAKNPLASESNKIKYQQEQLTLQGLKDNLADYEKDLSELVYTTSAAVEGKVTEVCVDEGTYTEENTVILKLANFNQLIVSADIEEYDAPLLKLGQKVVMTSDGLEGKEYTGTIIKISPSAADTSTNMGTETTVPIEISVDNPDGVLKPGYNLDLEITVSEKDDLVMVSSSAIGKDKEAGTSYVYKVNDDKTLEKVVVETGDTDDTMIEITSGVSEGDTIIKSVSDSIKEGMTLEEVMALEMEAKSQAASSSGENNSNGGNGDDRNQQSGQMLQPGGFGGGGPGGGGPMGR